MTLRCCWLTQPARATSTNCNRCDGDGTAASVSEAEIGGASAASFRCHTGFWTVRPRGRVVTLIELSQTTPFLRARRSVRSPLATLPAVSGGYDVRLRRHHDLVDSPAVIRNHEIALYRPERSGGLKAGRAGAVRIHVVCPVHVAAADRRQDRAVNTGRVCKTTVAVEQSNADGNEWFGRVRSDGANARHDDSVFTAKGRIAAGL